MVSRFHTRIRILSLFAKPYREKPLDTGCCLDQQRTARCTEAPVFSSDLNDHSKTRLARGVSK